MLNKIIATIFAKGSVALINFAILLISSQQLGGDVRGQVGLLLLNIAIIQAVNEIYTGYSLVYFIPTHSLKKVYVNGLIWTLVCTGLLSLIFAVFKIGLHEQWIHVSILSFIVILHSFHGVIILAKERIRIYNFLNFFQPAILLIVLLIQIFFFDQKQVDSYIIALYASFLISLVISGFQIFSIFNHFSEKFSDFNSRQIIQNGFYNQLANLSHFLSSRYSFYLLANTTLVGIYSSASPLIESILIISNSAAPLVLTYIANKRNVELNVQLTFLLSKMCFLLTLCFVLILFFVPAEFFSYLLGKDFGSTKLVMLSLSPGVLFISFSTIISHYFSGLGRQKQIAIANFSGFVVTVVSSFFFIPNFQLFGACYATSLSYFVASAILVYLFMMENKLPFTSLFALKGDFKLLRSIQG